MKFIIGKKLGMTQIFDQNGKSIPVTLVEQEPCQIKGERTEEKDGYKAFQMSWGKGRTKEFPKEKEEYKKGDKMEVSLFKEGEKVKVSGLSKGKGFQGGVKKWGFSGRGATHGVKHEHRTLGSVGSAYPERVIKGKKMPGRMGNARITVRNLKVVKIDPESGILALKGALPGPKGRILEIRSCS